MSTFPKGILAADAFDPLRNSHGVILNEFDVSRASTALQGLQAVLAVLQRSDGATLGPGTGLGLIAAAAACAELVELAIEGEHFGMRAEFATPAYTELAEARHRVMAAYREEVSV